MAIPRTGQILYYSMLTLVQDKNEKPEQLAALSQYRTLHTDLHSNCGNRHRLMQNQSQYQDNIATKLNNLVRTVPTLSKKELKQHKATTGTIRKKKKN